LVSCHFCVGYCVFVDAEHALDPALAEAIGVKTEKLLLSQPDCGEQALSLVDTLIRSGSVDVVVVDSVSKVLYLFNLFLPGIQDHCW
jgi:recombination protein RecA